MNYRRFDSKQYRVIIKIGYSLGDSGCMRKMDDADLKLGTRAKLFYVLSLIPPRRLHFTLAVAQNPSLLSFMRVLH